MEGSDMDNNPSILSHVAIGTNHFERAVAFYDPVLATLGCKRLMEHPGAIAYGKQYPEFWVQTPINGQLATTGNGTHVGFVAPTKAAVLDLNTANHTTAALFAIQTDTRWKHPFGICSLITTLSNISREKTPMTVQPIPDGYHTITPYLTVAGAAQLMELTGI